MGEIGTKSGSGPARSACTIIWEINLDGALMDSNA
jgi:hypothetical protein